MDPMIGMIVCTAIGFVPKDWKACDGQELKKADYPELFKLLLNTYGGDGITTFKLPDLRGRTAIQAGNNYKLGAAAGIDSLPLTIDHLPPHKHDGKPDLKLGASSEIGLDTSAVDGYPSEFTHAYGRAGDKFMAEPDYDATAGNTGTGRPVNSRSPFLVMTYIICVNGAIPQRP